LETMPPAPPAPKSPQATPPGNRAGGTARNPPLSGLCPPHSPGSPRKNKAVINPGPYATNRGQEHRRFFAAPNFPGPGARNCNPGLVAFFRLKARPARPSPCWGNHFVFWQRTWVPPPFRGVTTHNPPPSAVFGCCHNPRMIHKGGNFPGGSPSWPATGPPPRRKLRRPRAPFGPPPAFGSGAGNIPKKGPNTRPPRTPPPHFPPPAKIARIPAPNAGAGTFEQWPPPGVSHSAPAVFRSGSRNPQPPRPGDRVQENFLFILF